MQFNRAHSAAMNAGELPLSMFLRPWTSIRWKMLPVSSHLLRPRQIVTRHSPDPFAANPQLPIVNVNGLGREGQPEDVAVYLHKEQMV